MVATSSNMQKLEEEIIHYISGQFPSSEEVFGIGDDCAVIPGASEEDWVVTTDAFVEGIHFLKSQMPPKEVGYKAMAVNISDVAAMGGEPKYAFLTLALPNDFEPAWFKEVIAGMKYWDVEILGGDTVRSLRDIYFSITLIGSAPRKHIKYRHGAQVGDRICVTSFLGDSKGGLMALQESLDLQKLIHSHFHPTPSPQEGMWLAAQKEVHAMMDISDGLNCDLTRLLKASGCGATIDLEDIPISKALANASSEHSWNPLEIALTGGEEYCLLLTISDEEFKPLQKAFEKQFHHPLYCIGQIENEKGIRYKKNGKLTKLALKDFEHFSQKQ